MKKSVILIPLTVNLIVISGCTKVSENKDQIRMPLYSECINKISHFKDEMKKSYEDTNKKLFIELTLFNYESSNHPSFAGMITLSGKNLDMGLEVYANTIRGLCYPETSSTVENSDLGLRIIKEDIYQLEKKGNKVFYSEITKDKIKVFFNDGQSIWEE